MSHSHLPRTTPAKAAAHWSDRPSTPRPVVLRVLVGSPGAGKTTWCADNAHWVGAVLSLDRARAHLGAGEADQTATTAAVAWVTDRATMLLNTGVPVTIDATGAVASDRATWLTVAAEPGARPVAVVFRVPLEVALHRNASRRRVVPAAVLVQMWQHIAATSARDLLTEGFHAVTELTIHDEPAPHPAAAHDKPWSEANPS